MMLGYFIRKIKKEKLRIPKEFSFYFNDKMILVSNPEKGCLALEVADNVLSKEKHIYQTTIKDDVLVLPSWLRVISGIYSDEVILAGLIGKLEIWDKAVWKEMIKSERDLKAFKFSKFWDRANEIFRSLRSEGQERSNEDSFQKELKEAYLNNGFYRYFYYNPNFNSKIVSWSIIKAYFEEWQDKILSIEELDKKVLEKNITELYKFSGYERPMFIWCPSPLSMALTFILSKLLELEAPDSTFLLWTQLINDLSLPPFNLKDKVRKKFLDALLKNLAKVRKRKEVGELIKHDLIPYEKVGYILDFTPFSLSIEDIDEDHQVKKKFFEIFFIKSPYSLPHFKLNVNSDSLQNEYDKVLVGRPYGIAICYHYAHDVNSALKVGFEIDYNVAFLKYLLSNDIFPLDIKIRVKMFLSIAEAGVPFIPCEHVCFICERPTFLEIHLFKFSEQYPQAKIWLTASFKDGFITKQEIPAYELVRLQHLYAKFCNFASALSYLKRRKTDTVFEFFSEVIDTYGDYVLLAKDLHIAKDRRMRIQALKMKCPSTGKIYYELVPPNVRTCKEALSWRVGGLEWNPEEHT